MTLLRHFLLVGVAAFLSWFVLLRTPSTSDLPVVPLKEESSLQSSDLKLAVRPRVEQPATVEEPRVDPTPAAAAPIETETPEPELELPAPPAPERGAPDGTESGELPPPSPSAEELLAETSEPEGETEPASNAEASSAGEPARGPQGKPRSRFLEDSELLAEAERELKGETRVGFETRILSAPEDQLEIARSFGGQIVLVPRAAIDPNKDAAKAVWFRVKPDPSGANGQASVERVVGSPELSNWTRYRDLFDYEYARLPAAVRDLRRSVLSRAEVFLFASLISPKEWALVVGRRSEALQTAGRRPAELRSATLRAIRTPEGFDFRVESLEYEQASSN